jgi:hypothetical protein
MRVLPPVAEQIRRIIRDERAKDPLITASGLEHALEKHFDRGFPHQYVSKIADKVPAKVSSRWTTPASKMRMNFTRENYRMMREKLLKIVYWNPETALWASPSRSHATTRSRQKRGHDGPRLTRRRDRQWDVQKAH